MGSHNLWQLICVFGVTQCILVENFDYVFIFVWKCAQVGEEDTKELCTGSVAATSGRWFVLSAGLVLKGRLGIYRVTHLMRREGRDGTAPHRERCSQNNDSILAKTQPAPAKHSKYVRSQQRRPKHPKFSRQGTELLPLGATRCIYIQAQTKARKAVEGWKTKFFSSQENVYRWARWKISSHNSLPE